MSAPDAVTVAVDGGIATVTLSRPDSRNAWDDTLGAGMEEAFTALGADADVRCVLLRGAGTVFCAGADLIAGFPTLPNGSDDLRRTLRHRFHPAFFALLDLPQPVVAAVHGPAIGAGACLALAADVAVMGRGTYLQFRFTQIGLMPDVGATALLGTLVGPARAAEIFFLAERLGAERCERLGLVSRVVDDDAVVVEAEAVAGRLAAGPTRAYATTKRALRGWTQAQLAEQCEREATLQQTLIASDDWEEGRRAFRERRDPRFTGR